MPTCNSNIRVDGVRTQRMSGLITNALSVTVAGRSGFSFPAHLYFRFPPPGGLIDTRESIWTAEKAQSNECCSYTSLHLVHSYICINFHCNLAPSTFNPSSNSYFTMSPTTTPAAPISLKDLTIENITNNVRAINSTCPDPRLKFTLERVVVHLHDLARETRLSTAEWMKALLFLTEVGQICSDVRQVGGLSKTGRSEQATAIRH